LAFFNPTGATVPATVTVTEAGTLNLGATRGFTETIVRLRAPQRTNSDGLPVVQRDWTDTSELTVIGVNVQPLSSREAVAGDARTVTTTLVLITRPRSDVDITVGDRILWQGRTLEVVAEPEKWPAPGGGVDHVEAILQSAPPWPGAGGDTTSGHTRAGAQTAAVGWRP
jgi:head-tail adaptor